MLLAGAFRLVVDFDSLSVSLNGGLASGACRAGSECSLAGGDFFGPRPIHVSLKALKRAETWETGVAAWQKDWAPGGVEKV